MTHTSEIEKEYLSSLSDLNVNIKPSINMLTMLAEENIQHGQVVVDAIEKHITKSPLDGLHNTSTDISKTAIPNLADPDGNIEVTPKLPQQQQKQRSYQRMGEMKKHQCKFCQKRYIRFGFLLRHQLFKHSTEPE